MMAVALTDGTILGEKGWLEGQALLIDGTHITGLVGAADIPAGYEITNLQGQYLVPGFIDIQVNGGGGVLFNDAPTLDGVRAIAEAHRPFGTTGMLPTLISDDLDVVAAAIKAVDDAIEAGVPGILGIHIEGPFLAPDKKGVHDAGKFRVLDDDAVVLLATLKHGVTHVTLAPEQTTPEMIARLKAAGVVISAGHTNATYEETTNAIKAGVTGFTHLFNAMSALMGRAPGVVGAALADADTYAGIIADGHHVHAGSLKVALRAKGPNHLMLVTDAMPSVGMTDKIFTLQGRTITVEGGKCTAPDGTLAGSDLDMAGAVKNTVQMLDVPLDTAIRMASANPAAFLGLTNSLGSIRAGKRANLVQMNRDCQVARAWIDGTEYTSGKTA